MAGIKTSISINNTTLDKLRKISTKLNIYKSKIIQILLEDFFNLNEEEQTNILHKYKEMALKNRQNSATKAESDPINIFINLKILRYEMDFSSKTDITRSILSEMILEEFFNLDEAEQVNFLINNKKRH